jgi:tetratricopeptide (TPR) repeat protein
VARLAVLLAFSLFAAFADGATEGRRGNQHLAAGEWAEAVAAYREGLANTEDEQTPVRTALWNNLGLALFAQEQFTDAAEAFEEAMQSEGERRARARFAYNAGTALARADQLDEALGLLRRALIARPDFPEARHNYEWVQRRLSAGQPPSEGTPPEPSDFARRLKARADSLVEARQYTEALDAMTEGLRQDSTVAAFADFMQRLGEVVAIDSSAASNPLP